MKRTAVGLVHLFLGASLFLAQWAPLNAHTRREFALAADSLPQGNQADAALQEGRRLLKRGQADQALGHLETALRLYTAAKSNRGVAAAHNGGAFKRASGTAGIAPSDGEVAVEWTYRAVLTPWFAVQPDVQYVIHPGGIAPPENALVLGLRSELTF